MEIRGLRAFAATLVPTSTHLRCDCLENRRAVIDQRSVQTTLAFSMGSRLVHAIVWLCAGIGACTKHNPESCCTTPTECASFGLSGVVGCAGSQVCDATGTCVDPQC